MPESSSYPRYSFPPSLALGIILSLIVGKKRDFKEDSRRACLGIHPSPVVIGVEHIPVRGPLLVTLNHYSRPGFFIIWAALVISANLPDNPVWMMTRALTRHTGGWDQIRTGLTRMIFGRLAYIYGFVTMPAMPPNPKEIIERAISVRRLLSKLHSYTEPVLCLAPEGMDFPGGELGCPYAGSGKLILQLTALLNQIQPVGVYEEDGKFIVCFGRTYRLQVPDQAKDVDAFAIRRVMTKIAGLLPERMRGDYA